ncbi:hypothetical protein [Bordetella genomosp. 1]|uniref:Uncharacterized protein n=1 Tax=Bordetella genomosp. 1 TaxID=1395607 RepID=A0ABX4F162_9BORD|nr:hypothetical protein [Bordetella genomosp. 1]OZI65735.1 hypothetical protein CAL27_12020 [Bordetella genomosp. 1]
MLKHLQQAALSADIAALDALLDARTESEDPIGRFQLAARRAELLERVRRAGETASCRATVALHFGGKPVTGALGVDASFAGRALEKFQDIVANRHASSTRGEALKDRDPVPHGQDAALMITEIARGSFGFILEESETSARDHPVEPALKNAVGEVATLMRDLAQDDLESSVDLIDERLLASLRDFFTLIDEAGATVRLVAGNHDVQLDRDAVHGARLKTESIEVRVSERTETGILYITPDSQRFDLELEGGQEVVKGRLDRCLLTRLRDHHDERLKAILGTTVQATLSVQDVIAPAGNLRSSHILVDVS